MITHASAPNTYRGHVIHWDDETEGWFCTIHTPCERDSHVMCRLWSKNWDKLKELIDDTYA